MGIIAGMDASSGEAVTRVNDARRLVRDAARSLPSRARAGVVRSHRRRHLRLSGHPDRPARATRSWRRAASPRAGRSTRKPPAQILADPHWLPFPENSLDLIVLPHALEFTSDPHQLLREVYRAMRAEGQIVISGFNPFSLFGAQPLFRTRRDRAVERQLHRAVPAEGLARAARIRGHRRRSRLLRAAVRQRAMARAIRLLRGGRRPLVADRGGRLLPARDEEGARDAHHHAGVGAPQERPRHGSAAGAPVHRARRMTGSRVVDLHGRRVQGKSGARRLGRAPGVGRSREGALRRRERPRRTTGWSSPRSSARSSR